MTGTSVTAAMFCATNREYTQISSMKANAGAQRAGMLSVSHPQTPIRRPLKDSGPSVSTKSPNSSGLTQMSSTA